MSIRSEAFDEGHMDAALGLARRGLGQVWPNPSVGCVIVRNGRVIGRGWTQPGGRPHAETVALRQAGSAAQGATAYVTLEPCSHHGKTPPCAEALVEAGIARVVVGAQDPDPRVSGRGLAILAQAGLDVVSGIRAEQAEALHAGFFTRIRLGRPLVTLKTATSLDGRIATHSGKSQWITGEAARAAGHRLRAENDAILVGINTVLADDPLLTCRLPGLEKHQPLRIVLDTHLRLPLVSRLVKSAKDHPLWVLCRGDADAGRRNALAECGAELIFVPVDSAGVLDIMAALHELGRRGLTRLLVEGGAHVASALARAGLIDRIAWFRAPIVVGGDGLAALVGFGIDAPSQAPRFRLVASHRFGADQHDLYERIG